MSQKQTKMYVRTIKRNRNKIIKEHIEMLKRYKLFNRIKFAFAIIFRTNF